jgi:hypothetical protein
MFKNIIKIPNKESFEDLSLYEIGLMIEADSALSKEGSESFDSCALDEFLHFRSFKNHPEMQKIQSHILENIYLEIPGRKNKEINTAFLKAYAKELKNQNSDL